MLYFAHGWPLETSLDSLLVLVEIGTGDTSLTVVLFSCTASVDSACLCLCLFILCIPSLYLHVLFSFF
jgi:hypothetical protein